jgi:hypothetical protein
MSSPMTKKLESVPLASTVMLMLFWNFNGPISSITRIMDRWSVVHSIILCLKGAETFYSH